MDEQFRFHILGRVRLETTDLLASESMVAESLTAMGALKAAKALVLMHMHKKEGTTENVSKAWHLVENDCTFLAATVRRRYLKTYEAMPEPKVISEKRF